MLPVRCVCGERYEVEDTMAGGEVRCPSCGRRTIVPEGATPPTPKATFRGLSTAKYVPQTAESNLTAEQARRIAKHRSKTLSRSRGFWSAPMMASGGGISLIVVFFFCGVPGLLIWGIGLAIIAGFAAFFNYLDRQAAAREIFETEQELEEQMEEESSEQA